MHDMVHVRQVHQMLKPLPQHLYPWLPIPLAAILVTLLYNGRIAITCAITLALLLGTQSGQTDAATLFFGIAGGVAGAISMRVVRRRSQVLVSIAAIAVAYAIAACTYGLMAGWSADDMLRSSGIGGIVALVSTSVAMALLPLAEWLTRITTDLRLLELAAGGIEAIGREQARVLSGA